MILVVGATGSLGGRITRGLLAQGKQVQVLARNNPLTEVLAAQGRANTVRSLVEAGAQPVQGDLKDPGSLARALQGIDTVITTATATQREGDDTLQSVDLNGTLALIEAAKAAGVKRLIYISSVGAAEGHPVEIYHIKGTCEAALQKSGLEYTIFRPPAFMEIWIGMVIGIPLMHQQPVSLIGKGDHKHNLISEADVAAFSIAAVDNPLAANQLLTIGGPTSYTWTEIVHTAGETLGAPLQIEYLPLGSNLPLQLPAVVSLLNAMETFESFVDMSELAPAYGLQLTSLETYLQRAFAPRTEPA